MEATAKQLTRSRHNRVFGGICGGLADYLATDVVLVRIVYLALTLISVPVGVLLYIVAWIIMPLESVVAGQPEAPPSRSPGRARLILGGALVVAGLLALLSSFMLWLSHSGVPWILWPRPGILSLWRLPLATFFAPLALVVCGLLLILWRTHRDEPGPPPLAGRTSEAGERPVVEPVTSTTEPRSLTRVYAGRKLAGVCAGLGVYFNVDPVVVRLIWVALALTGGVGLLLYVIAWIVIPMEK